MVKVGFIDYYLDEWHANNYPELIKTRSSGLYEVAYAYGMIDSPVGGMTNEEWSKKTGVSLVASVDELIEKSDRIIVLSPDNPEMHEELCKKALASGKLVYVDKTFAPDKETAERIFANADENGTKCFSSSALRFSAEFSDIDKNKINAIYCESGGDFEVYLIHQIEPVVQFINAPVKRVMYTGIGENHSVIIEFLGEKKAEIRFCRDIPFRYTFVDKDGCAVHKIIESDFFARFIDAVIKFFDSGEIPVPHSETIDVIAIRKAAILAKEKPFEWIEIN